jgi:hypothetical protein
MNVTVLDCPGNSSWLPSTRSIVILCWPGGRSLTSIVPESLVSAQCHGSPMTCRRCKTVTETTALGVELVDNPSQQASQTHLSGAFLSFAPGIVTAWPRPW